MEEKLLAEDMEQKQYQEAFEIKKYIHLENSVTFLDFKGGHTVTFRILLQYIRLLLTHSEQSSVVKNFTV